MLSVRFPVYDQRAVRSQRERGTRSCIFYGVRGRNHYRGVVAAHDRSCFGNCCRKCHIVAATNQCLRQSFQQRDVRANQNHFTQRPTPQLLPGPRQRNPLPAATPVARRSRIRCTHCAAKFLMQLRSTRSNSRSPQTSLKRKDSMMLRRMYATIGVMSSPPSTGTTRRSGDRIGSLSR
jgi:hypothetical protein